MTLEQQATLAGGTRSVQTWQGLVSGTQHTVLCINGESTLAVYEDRAHRAQCHIRTATEWALTGR